MNRKQRRTKKNPEKKMQFYYDPIIGLRYFNIESNKQSFNHGSNFF